MTVATAHVALPHARCIADATGKPDSILLLATILARVDLSEAEQLLREVLDRAVTAKDFQTAHEAGSTLAALMRATGRLREALTVLDQMTEHSRRAELGPWTQVADRGQRLQILRRLGENEQVLAEVEALRAEMDRLPDRAEPGESVRPWNTREATLTTGVLAAHGLGRWQQALDLNAEVLASHRRRRAGPHEIAIVRLNDCIALEGLGHLDEAEAALRECQRVYEDEQDIRLLGKVLGTRASVAARRGHLYEAIAHQRTTLRLMYVQPDFRDVAGAHHNLAIYLGSGGGDPAGQVGHWVAAALIRYLTGARGELAESISALAKDLQNLGEQAWLPGSVADIAGQVDQIEGVRFTALISDLAPDRETAEVALAEINQVAQNLPTEQARAIQQHLDRWEPGITNLVAAARGDQRATTTVAELLDHLADTQGWRALARALRRVLDGERDIDALVVGLDPVSTAVVRAIVDRLATASS